MTTTPAILDWSARITAACLAARRPVRDVMADDAQLHREPAAVRAQVARTAQAAVGSRRRLEWALWGDEAPDLGSVERAKALVLAQAIEAGTTTVDDARRQFAATGRGQVDFAGVPEIARRLAAEPDAQRAFAIRHSMPDHFVTRLQRAFGDEADAVARALAAPAPRTLRTNTLRCTRDQLCTELAANGIAATDTRWSPWGLSVEGDADLFALPCYERGWFEQQDEASQLAAAIVQPPPGGRVLDLCAGAGGKTLAVAAMLQNRGEVLASDVHAGRLQELRRRARRAGANNVRAVEVAGTGPDRLVDAFGPRADRILVDAPCSGSGSWRRRPEARWGIDEARLHALVATQRGLLERAVDLLAPGARVVYATCSLLPEENEAQVEWLTARRAELEVVRVKELLGADAARPIADGTGTFLALRPDRHGTDGFFAAVLRRRRTK